MTQVSINPNTRNVVGDDKALYLQQLEEQDPNGFKALSNLIVDLTDVQEYTDGQPIKDLTRRQDPGQSDVSLGGDILHHFLIGVGLRLGVAELFFLISFLRLHRA